MEELVKNRNGWLENSTHRQCTNCLCIFEKNAGNTSRLCKTCNTTRVKSQSAESKMYRRAKSRARIGNYPFDIEMSDIIIPKECPILKIPMYVTTGKSGGFNNSPSLDKIDPANGYVKGNIIVISQLANAMKSNASVAHLLSFSDWINETYRGDELNEPSLT